MGELPVIVNPVAGGGRAARLAQHAVAQLRVRGVDARLIPTTATGEATALAADWVRRGASVVGAAGGDGTMHEVAQALAGTETALGVLPFGRGNDFATALGVPRTVDGVVETLVHGGRRQVDVGRVGDQVFCSVASAGFDAEVAMRTRTGWWRRAGSLAYPLAAIAGLGRLRATAMTIEGDFGRREGPYLIVAMSNTGWYGGGIQVAPDARADDGLLDCVLIRAVPRWQLLVLLPLAYRGWHLRFRAVEVVRSRAVRVASAVPLPVIADGEAVGGTPVSCRVERGALAVLVPRGSE